jgi:hypothetical protein
MLSISDGRVKLGIALGTVLLVTGAVVGASVFPTATNQGYAPEQPIPFSHKLHAGDNKIACAYCHSNVEKSRHATVPALSVCMNCHSVVAPDSPHIQKIKAAYAEGKPIEWIRVHELPDYAFFPHKRHIAAGLQCESCHGDVKGMETVSQFAPLTMGWCMECHRGQTTPRAVLSKFYPGQKNPHGPVAPTNCVTCHN